MYIYKIKLIISLFNNKTNIQVHKFNLDNIDIVINQWYSSTLNCSNAYQSMLNSLIYLQHSVYVVPVILLCHKLWINAYLVLNNPKI